MEMHSNNCAREWRPNVWIFHGRSVIYLVAGAAMFMAMFRILAAYDVDWPVNLAISLLPIIVAVVYVQLFVNGKPPSYASDRFLFFSWRLRTRLYMNGIKDRPPELWVRDKALIHPKEF